MTHYSNDVRQVRVDLFKPSGKWDRTVELLWDRYTAYHSGDTSSELIHETFRRCMSGQYPGLPPGWIAVCLEPYHEHAHPLLLTL